MAFSPLRAEAIRHGIDPSELDAFMSLYRRRCPHVDDMITIEDFADAIGWPVERVNTVGWFLQERGLIETDAGLGGRISVLEGRSGT